MSLPTHDTTEQAPAEAVVIAPTVPAPDYEALRKQYEEHELMGTILAQMGQLNQQVAQITNKHFPKGFQLTLECDPEIDDAYFIVKVQAPDTVDKIVITRDAWIDELWNELRESSRFYHLRMTPYEAG